MELNCLSYEEMCSVAKMVVKFDIDEVEERAKKSNCSLYEAVVNHIFYKGLANGLDFDSSYIFIEKIMDNLKLIGKV